MSERPIIHRPSELGFENLAPEQQAVADSVDQAILVLGGAGVGKTTTALWAARRQLTAGDTRKPLPGERVLFITFSRTAVSQIRARSRGVLRGLTDSVEILTFHGLAYRLLSAFGRYCGIQGRPTLAGEARAKLDASSTTGRLSYGELIPRALRLVEGPGPIGDLLRARWSLVICDEFQDTDDLEWRLVQAVSTHARLMLLADPNQMIYQFKTGVSEARLDAARMHRRCREIVLPPGSHRDPTQVLATAASDIRWRRFDAPAVSAAVEQKRLIVRADVPDEVEERGRVIASEVALLRAEEYRSIGIYAKTNSDAAELSAALTESGVDHVPIGFNEAYGETLACMLQMIHFAQRAASWGDVLKSLATVLTANDRGPRPPQLAVALYRDGAVLGQLAARLASLRASLEGAGNDISLAASYATGAWERLGLTTGRRAWSRASRTFGSLMSRALLTDSDPLPHLGRSIDVVRDASFVELDAGDAGAIQLMNFSQTKGREADATILSYTSSDFYGRGVGEPYDEASRILYVSMTRARERVVVLLPAEPHPLVAPFLRFA